MILAALVFSACQCLVFFCFFLLVRSWVARQERKYRQELQELVRSFVEAPDDKTPSPLAVLIDQGATLLAARLMQQLKAMLAGVESGLSKQESAQMLGAATEGSPFLGMLAGILPKRVRAGLMKNPQMIGALANMVNNRGNGTGNDAEPARRRHRD